MNIAMYRCRHGVTVSAVAISLVTLGLSPFSEVSDVIRGIEAINTENDLILQATSPATVHPFSYLKPV